MTGPSKRRWTTVVTLGIGILVGGGVVARVTLPPPLPEIHANADSRHDQQLVHLEQAVTALTQAVQVSQTTNTCAEPTQVTAPANTEVSRQDRAQRH